MCVAAVRFYDGQGAIKIGMMEAFKKLAVGPDALPDIIFASIGRTIWKVSLPGSSNLEISMPTAEC